MIAGAPLDILDYFSQEFEVENCQKWKNTYIYPFCGELLGMLTCLHEEKKAKFLAKRVLEHNEKTYKKVVSMLDAAYEIEWKEKCRSGVERGRRTIKYIKTFRKVLKWEL